MDADDFDDWCKWHRWFPIDHQSNYHVPIAALHAATLNINRSSDAAPLSLYDCLVFAGVKARDVEIGEAQGW